MRASRSAARGLVSRPSNEENWVLIPCGRGIQGIQKAMKASGDEEKQLSTEALRSDGALCFCSWIALTGCMSHTAVSEKHFGLMSLPDSTSHILHEHVCSFRPPRSWRGSAGCGSSRAGAERLGSPVLSGVAGSTPGICPQRPAPLQWRLREARSLMWGQALLPIPRHLYGRVKKPTLLGQVGWRLQGGPSHLGVFRVHLVRRRDSAWVYGCWPWSSSLGRRRGAT